MGAAEKWAQTATEHLGQPVVAAALFTHVGAMTAVISPVAGLLAGRKAKKAGIDEEGLRGQSLLAVTATHLHVLEPGMSFGRSIKTERASWPREKLRATAESSALNRRIVIEIVPDRKVAFETSRRSPGAQEVIEALTEPR